MSSQFPQRWLTQPLICIALALCSGALITLSFAPFNIWPASILGLYGLLHLLQNTTPRQAGWRGWWFGIGLFGSGSSWVYVSIHVYGYAPVPLAAFLTLLWTMGLALLVAAFGWCYRRFFAGQKDTLPSNTILLGFPALWVLFEWLRSWLLTGFPWLFLGYGGMETWLSGWAPVAGVYSLSFILALSAAALYTLLHSKAEKRQTQSTKSAIVIGLIILWLAGLGLSHIDWAEKGKALDIGIVQANIPQELKWRPEHYVATLNTYGQMTRELGQQDIIVWPEAAIPNYYHRAQDYLQRQAKRASQQNTTLVTGIPYINSDKRAHNSIVALGEGSGLYHKQRLVPFGEYVPLESLLRGLIQFFDLPMSNFASGGSNQALLQAGQYQLSPYICYEIVYPDLVRQQAGQADLLVTISNDSWFGDSLGPLQHLQMAQMRALENGRYLIRATNNGVSAIINNKGQIETKSEQFVAQTLTGKAYILSGRTPFSHTGSWPILALCFVLLLTTRLSTGKHR